MRSLKLLIVVFVVLISLSLQAAKAKNQKMFSLVVIKKYTKQHTEIYKENEEYYCKTELIPKFLIKKQKYETDIATEVEKLKKSSTVESANCSADPVMLTVGKESFKSCSTLESAKKIIALLAEECGRNL